MTQTTASSPAKLILFGEHAVVHGFQAVVATLKLIVEATIEEDTDTTHSYPPLIANILKIFENQYHKSVNTIRISLNSEIPIGCCLGSSAATANAIFQALLTHFDIHFTKEKLLDLVYESEKFAHGNPSGLDPIAVVYGGIIEFQKIDGKLTFSQIKTKSFSDKTFFLIQSGKPVETTKEMIAKVQTLIDKDPQKKSVLEKIGALSTQIIQDLKSDQFDSQWIAENERLLEQIEVVGDKAKRMIAQIEEVGGIAKVTGGAGYQSGSGMLWAYHKDPATLEKLINKNNWTYFTTQLGNV